MKIVVGKMSDDCDVLNDSIVHGGLRAMKGVNNSAE
jgi:hypothetical protein